MARGSFVHVGHTADCTTFSVESVYMAGCVGRDPLPGYDPVAHRQEAASGRRTSSGALPGESLCHHDTFIH